MVGCAVGVLRHGVFILGDDDLDIFMTFENYSNLKRVFSNNPYPNLQIP